MLVRCRESFIKGKKGGGEVLVAVGDIFDDSHEYVRGTPADYWEKLHVRGVVEEATAVPGKKRTTRAPADS